MWMNDFMLGGWTPTQSKDGLKRVIQQFKDKNADVLLLSTVAPNPSAGFGAYPAIPDAHYRVIRQGLYDLAGSMDVPLLDAAYRHGDYSVASVGGLMADAIHPNSSGYAAIARAVESIISS
jgi:lysophospholipase L1-like esterase